MMVGIAAQKDYMTFACQIVGKNFTDESFGKENLYLVSEDRWMTAGIDDLPSDTISVCTDAVDDGKVFLVFKLPEEYQSEENETAINYMKAKLFDFCLKNPYDLTTFVGFDFRIYYV